jgi:hypothetical protein
LRNLRHHAVDVIDESVVAQAVRRIGRDGDNVRALRAAGAEVTFEPMENADHFVVFVEREKVLAKLERWLKATR